MSSKFILKDKDGNSYDYDAILTQGYLEGQVPGVEHACGFLMEAAKEAFSVSQDKEAQSLRSLVTKLRRELVPALQKAAKEHKQSFQEAFPSFVDPDERAMHNGKPLT